MIKSDVPFGLYNGEENFRKLKCLFYGPSGVGKTVLAGSISAVPCLSPALGQDIEGGMTSLSSFGYDDIDLTRINSFTCGQDSFMRVYKYLASPENKYGSTILDSLTELQALIIDEALLEEGKKKPDLAVWNLVAGKTRKVVRRIRDLPIHVVVTALDRQVKDESTGIMVKQPALVGKMSEELMGYFDIVGRLETKRTKEGLVRVAYFEGDETFRAKDRTHSLGKKMENPTMEKIWSLIREKHKHKIVSRSV